MGLFKKKEKKGPVYDYTDAINKIKSITGFDTETIISILEAEEIYMTDIGIMDGTYIREDQMYREDKGGM